uniref:Translation initiation factor eIF2B subunit beta n=1 Tax=Corethrella appendiculata TaxID=1370023 RepID=U5ES47_9DIPT
MTGLKVENPLENVTKLIHDVKLRKIEGSFRLANCTLELCKEIITTIEWKTAEQLMNILHVQGNILSSALPHEVVIGNIIRRILKIIREEYDSSVQVKHQYECDTQSIAKSLHKLVTQTSDQDKIVDYSKPQDGLKSALLDHMQEIETELETSLDNLAEQSVEHIHSSELIMTLGYSVTVEKFLKNAAKHRKIEVIVAECAPGCKGQQLAASLAKFKIETTLIPDSSIFAMMSRVNKVIIGTHCVLANGGLRAICGSYSLALAAKHYSVPVIVLAPMYKLTPIFLCNYEQDAFNIVGSTETVLPYNSIAARFCKAYSPIFDYVPPELVTLFISNVGGNAPSYVYRLLSELYYSEDYEL